MSTIHQIVDKVYVINLDKDKERMAHMDKQCKEHQIQYTRFPAILGSKVEKDPRLSPTCQIFCTDGAKGCALSHHSIWEDMIKNNLTNALVLEDDGIFAKDFDYKVHQAFQSIPSYDIVYLNSTYNASNSNILSSTIHSVAGITPEDHTPLLKRTNGGLGLAAYVIHIDFVRKIIDKPMTQHIDYQLTMWLQELNGRAYTMTNYAVHTDENPFESNLADKFPILLNTVLKQLKFEGTPDMSWIANENLIKLGWFNINTLLLLTCFGVLVTPKRYMYAWFLWLVLEGLIAKDIWNTLRYGFFFGFIRFIRFRT
jgi:GR25 family glycosyltransferase involved in LPS biosynthesis